MQPIDVDGSWHLPGERDRPVAGRLHYSPRHGLILSLIGSLGEGGFPRPDVPEYPIIHGVITESPYFGKLVTLVDCFRRTARLRIPRFISEEIWANRAYVGTRHLDGEGTSRFISLRASYANLAEWTGLTGFKGFVSEFDRSTGIISARYERPSPVELRIGKADNPRLEVRPTTSTGHHRFEISEEVQLIFSDVAGFAAPDVQRDLISPFEDFLTFAVDRPSPLEDVTFVTEPPADTRPGDFVNLLFQPVYVPPDEPTIHSHMLFTWTEIESIHRDVFREWLRFRSQFRAPCDVYFGLMYGPPDFLETKFLLLVTALSLFLAGRVPDQSVRDAVETLRRATPGSDSAGWIEMLPAPEELCLPQALRALIDDYRDLVTPALGNNPDTFVLDLMDSRRHLFTRQASESRSGVRLLQTVEQLTLLTKIQILEHLGFSRAVITDFISRNRTYRYLVGHAR